MIWLFSANKIKSSESSSKQQTQLIVNSTHYWGRLDKTENEQFHLKRKLLVHWSELLPVLYIEQPQWQK